MGSKSPVVVEYIAANAKLSEWAVVDVLRLGIKMDSHVPTGKLSAANVSGGKDNSRPITSCNFPEANS